MIGTVHHGMTVQAGPVDREYWIGSQHAWLVPSLHVALLAEPRDFCNEQLVIGRAVRGMADEAVLFYRWMLPENRRFLLGVAFIAFIIYGFCAYEPFRLSAVGIVTGRTFHLARCIRCRRISEGMPGPLKQCSAQIGMAGEADILFLLPGQESVSVPVYFMATGACNVVVRMGASIPEGKHFVAAVTTHAGLDRVFRFGFGWIDDCGGIARLGVVSARAVAWFTACFACPGRTSPAVNVFRIHPGNVFMAFPARFTPCVAGLLSIYLRRVQKKQNENGKARERIVFVFLQAIVHLLTPFQRWYARKWRILYRESTSRIASVLTLLSQRKDRMIIKKRVLMCRKRSAGNNVK
jgi:hypothetical protein